MFHGMFHEIIKFGFETFADIEQRGQHSLPRMNVDRTRSIETKRLGSWLATLIAGGADLDLALAFAPKLDN
jgi:hypothetical protein